MKISMEAGHREFGMYFPNRIKRSAIKQARKSNRGWGKWQIAMFIISTTRLLAKEGRLIKNNHGHAKTDMRTLIVIERIYEAALKNLDDRNLGHDCIVTKV